MSTRGRKPDLKAIDGGLKGVPSVPAWVPVEMVAEWNAVASDMVSRGILSRASIGLLESYMLARWSATQAQDAMVAHGVMVKGAHGALKSNPACGLLSKALISVARLGAELGISPAARSKSEFQSKGGAAYEGAPAGLDL